MVPKLAGEKDEHPVLQGRWSWFFGLIFWPFVAIAVLPWSALGALLLGVIGRVSQRRNRGEDSYLDMETEVGLAWVPVITTLGAFGVTAGFAFEDLSQGVPYAVASVVVVVVLSAQFVRQVGQHRNGRSPSIYSPDVDPEAALASLAENAASPQKVWLSGVARDAIDDGQNGGGVSNRELRSLLAPRHVLRRTLEAVWRQHKISSSVVIAWTTGLGFLAWNASESNAVLWGVSVVALFAFLSLGVVTYVDKVTIAFQASRRVIVLRSRVDAQRAASTPTRCAECVKREKTPERRSQIAKILAQIADWCESRVNPE